MGWKCGYCGTTGANVVAGRAHRCEQMPEKSTDQPPWACDACGLVFPSLDALQDHVALPSCRLARPLLTPYELGVLLHYYHRAGEGAWLEMEPANVARRKFTDIGFLHVPHPVGGWDLTARGRAYLDSLLRVPVPEAVWVTRWPQP